MQKVRSLTKKRIESFSLVEVLLAIGLFSMFIIALGGSMAYSLQSNEISSYKTKAVFLMDEGMEAARAIRNEAYTGLTDGTYGLAVASNKWALTGSSDTVGEFTRQIQISTVDTTTKQITSTVSWPQQFSTVNSVTDTMYLTNWLRSVSLGGFSPPVLASTLDFNGNDDGWKVAYKGNYAYIIRQTGSPNLLVVDVTNPASPSLAGSTTITNGATSIVISGNYAYVSSTDNSGEFRIFDITNPPSANASTTLDLSGNTDALSVAVSGTTAFIGRGSNGATNEFQIVNVSNPQVTPPLLGSVNSGSNVNDIALVGNYAYLATNNTSQEIQIINITNTSAPVQAGSVNISGSLNCTSITAFGTKLYIGCSNGLVYAYNITSPTAPVLYGSFATGSTAVNDIAVNSSIAVVATNSATAEFQAINITNPASMTLSGSLNTAASLAGLAFDDVNSRVYAVSSNNAGEFIIITSN